MFPNVKNSPSPGVSRKSEQLPRKAAAPAAQPSLLPRDEMSNGRSSALRRANFPPFSPLLTTFPADYKQHLRGMSDAQLAAEKLRLEARIADASSGPVQDPDAVARARAQLAELSTEQKTRTDNARSSDPKYASDIHQMSDLQLALERAREEERLNDATTGVDRDPAKAADARAKLAQLSREAARRTPEALPDDPATHPDNVIDHWIYSSKVSGMTDKERETERAHLNAVIKDATTGAHQDPIAAANAREKLAILEGADHKAEDSVAGYKEHLRGQTDAQLAAEKLHEQAVLKDATTGAHRDPDAAARARAKLGAIEGEQATRAANAKSKDPEFSKSIHGMDDKQLAAERAKQEERYREATTGADRDPVKAADAKAKLDQIRNEQFSRAIDHVFGGQLPKDSADKPLTTAAELAYRQGLRGDSPDALAAEKKRLEAVIKDASSGPNRDPGAVKNAQEKLKLVSDELADRARLARGPQPQYAQTAHGMGDAQLKLEVQRQEERLREATTGLDTDPRAAADARQKLAVLRAEQKDRAGDTLRIELGGAGPMIKAV